MFVDATPANAKRLRAALVEFGFEAVAPPVELLATRDKVFMLGRKPFRIDVLTGIDGVTFEGAWSGRTALKLGPLRIPVIGRAALVRNKRAAGRPKDLIDVLMLAEKRPHSPAQRATKERAAPTKRRR